MWKIYLADYLKNNRASVISIRVAAFIAALFLTFLCCLFYNFWLDNVEGTKLEEGDWHGRITGRIGEDDLWKIENFANVTKAAINTELSDDRQTVVDILFDKKRTIRQDMSLILDNLQLPENAASYNYQLLSLYFIRIPGDDMPRLLLPVYLMITGLVCLSLILIIYNAFAVSMSGRIHQFGIFASVGATPAQIRSCLVQEAFVLALVPILAGFLLGIGLGFAVVRAMSAFAAQQVNGRRITFELHPAIPAIGFLLSVLTVLISAWIPARRLSKLTPLEAIRGADELLFQKGRSKKALRTTSLSLTLSFLGFMLMQCFWTLSGISTEHTYFERYQNTWDVMVTVKDTRLEDFGLTEKARVLEEIDSCVIYQKADAVCRLPIEAQSEQLLSLGGLEAFAQGTESDREGTLLVEAPIVILDDGSFAQFCEQVGIAVRFDGVIVYNRFWDSINSNFRYPEYIPYIEDVDKITLLNSAESGAADSDHMAEIPVLACAEEGPLLREEYGKTDYPLVQFMPLSLWEKISGRIGGAQKDIYIRILAGDGAGLEVLNRIEDEMARIVGGAYETESENRIQEKIDNDKMISGYKLIMGAFCILLAVIAITHVFSNTLGFLLQRKREFARYMSVGLTPGGIRKIFCIEAAVTVGRPLLVALVFTTAAVVFMIKASFLDPLEFLRVAPVAPILSFVLAVFGFVALAYYLGGKKILHINLADVLRNDAMG